MKQVKNVGRFFVAVLSLVVMIILVPVIFVFSVWWFIVLNYGLWCFGPWIRRYGGRYLGCYPWLYLIIGFSFVVGLWRWAVKGLEVTTTVRIICGNLMNQLEANPEKTKRIGGLW